MLFLEDMSAMTDSQSDISEDLRSHATPSTPGLTGKQVVNRRLSTDSQNSESNTSAHRIYSLDQKVRGLLSPAVGSSNLNQLSSPNLTVFLKSAGEGSGRGCRRNADEGEALPSVERPQRSSRH